MIIKIWSLLRLRLLQSLRILQTVGWGLGLVFIFVIIGISFTMINNILHLDSRYSILFVGLFLLFLDFTRKDKMFLLMVFPENLWYRFYIGIEYMMAVLPILMFQFAFNKSSNGAIIFFEVVLIAFFSPLFKSIDESFKKSTVNIIPLYFFELKFFVEKMATFWKLFWFCGFLSFYHFAVYFIWIFFIIISLGEIFKFNEPREMLKWHKGYVLKKFQNYSFLMLKIILGQTILVFIMHSEFYIFSLYIILCLFVSLLLNLSVKYSSYSQNSMLHFGQTTVAIFTIISLIPGGIMITLSYVLYKFYKAESNLKLQYA